MLIIGIDPGKHGALSIINTYAFKDSYAIKFSENSEIDVYRYLAELKGGEAYGRMEALHKNPQSKIKSIQPLAPKTKPQDTSMEIWLEEPGYIQPPRNDISKSGLLAIKATRSLAKNVGLWQGLGIALNAPINVISPKTWQSRLSCQTGGRKAISRNLAKKIFWYLTNKNQRNIITDEIADALLIGLYGYIQYVPREKWPHACKENIPIN